MSQPIRGARALASLLVFLVAPLALAKRHTVDPGTQLSLDLEVKGTATCILVPRELYDPEVCAGLPPREATGPQGSDSSVRALVVLRQEHEGIVLTVTGISRPGIGQMSEGQIDSLIQGARKSASEGFGAPVRPVDGGATTFTIRRVNGVPVVRWEYTTDLPDSDERANTASAVVYLVPSIDTIDLLSFNTHRRNLEAARGIADQVISTLQVPLTIDAEQFGQEPAFILSEVAGWVLAPLAIAIGLGVWLWHRSNRAR